MTKIKVDLSIARNSMDEVTIQVEDETSRARFLDIKLTLEQFAFAVTGMRLSDVAAEVRALDFVGKTKIVEARSVECPLMAYDREELRAWLEENCKEEGWFLDSYLGSQSSIIRYDDKTVLNYSVYRYE